MTADFKSIQRIEKTLKGKQLLLYCNDFVEEVTSPICNASLERNMFAVMCHRDRNFTEISSDLQISPDSNVLNYDECRY